MNHIDVEIILERKIKYYVYIYIMIIIITILSLITFAILFNYKIYSIIFKKIIIKHQFRYRHFF